MAVSRVYTVDTNLAAGITIGSTTPGSEFPILWQSSLTEYNISAIRVSMISITGAPFYPANGSVTFRLRRESGAFTTGLNGGTATAAPVGPSTTAAASTWLLSTITNATGTFATAGAVLWEQTIPCTAGANWGEWFTPGFEINGGPGSPSLGTIALTYEYGNGTSVAVNIQAGLSISE